MCKINMNLLGEKWHILKHKGSFSSIFFFYYIFWICVTLYYIIIPCFSLFPLINFFFFVTITVLFSLCKFCPSFLGGFFFFVRFLWSAKQFTVWQRFRLVSLQFIHYNTQSFSLKHTCTVCSTYLIVFLCVLFMCSDVSVSFFSIYFLVCSFFHSYYLLYGIIKKMCISY